jgi:hypothetical protein
MIRPIALLAAATILLAVPSAVGAQRGGNGNGAPPPCDKPGMPPIKNPNCQQIALEIESDIDFGRMILLGTGAGQVWLDLATGQRVFTGGLDSAGGMPVTGRAVIVGTPMRPVRVELPASITMSDPAGGTALLRDFRTDLPTLPLLDSTGRLEFRFSGTLHADGGVGGGGRLRGRVPVTVSYD